MLEIRRAEAGDAEAVARLSAELGYPLAQDVVAERIAKINRSEDSVLLVACYRGEAVGWVDAGVSFHLVSGYSGMIHGLVVSSEYRNAGTGAALLERAEEWVASQGILQIVVRSRVERERAHGFYLKRGYVASKTQLVLAKALKSRAL